MFELIPYLPLPLLIVMVLLVIIPTAIAIMARLSLHKFLRENSQKVSRLLALGQERGMQPRIVTTLETRYKDISQQVEQVNTVALVDSVLADEYIKVWGFSLNCDQVEHLCKTLPNLLLAFGLLGTFWGITSNLYKVGRVIQNVEQTDINRLIQELQPQLQGMSIAFLTSLIALFCSSVLIIVNTRFNTGLVKYRLWSYLEDYLDNIYRPQAQGETRLDKAIDRMVKQQEDFLERFHQNVAQTMEESFGRAAQTFKLTAMNIAQETKKNHDLAERIYTGFAQSAKLVVEGAETFQDTTKRLATQTQTIERVMSQFKKDASHIQQGAQSFQAIAQQIEQSQYLEQVAQILESSHQAQSAFAESGQMLRDSSLEVTHQTASMMRSAQQASEHLDQSSSQIQTSVAEFQIAAQLINDSCFAAELSKAVTLWGEIQTQFAASTQAFGHHAEQIKRSQFFEQMQQILEQSSQIQSAFAESSETLSQGSRDLVSQSAMITKLAQQVYENLDQSSGQLQVSATEFHDAAQLMNDNRFAAELNNAVTQWGEIQTLFGASTEMFGQYTQQIEQSPFFEQMEQLLAQSNQVQTAFVEKSETLSQSSVTLVHQTETLTRLAQQVYEELGRSSHQLQASATGFQDVAKLIYEHDVAADLNPLMQALSQLGTQLNGLNQAIAACEQFPLAANLNGNEITTLPASPQEADNLNSMKQLLAQIQEQNQHLKALTDVLSNQSQPAVEKSDEVAINIATLSQNVQTINRILSQAQHGSREAENEKFSQKGANVTAPHPFWNLFKGDR